MGRHYITDENGEPVRDSDGNRQFWSDSDGDNNSDEQQTTYTDRGGLLGAGNTKNERTYNPTERRYNDD